MRQGFGVHASVVLPAAPRLLVDLEPRWTTFLSNARYWIRPPRFSPLESSSAPGKFWTDVFVHRSIPWGRILQSGMLHAAALVGLAAVSLLPSPPQTVALADTHIKPDVLYYTASEYLPPLHTGGVVAPKAAVSDPLPAPQTIISVPPEADNRRQTIVTPPAIKLKQEVPLPNIVAWSNKALPIAPVPALSANPQVRSFAANSVVAPPPDVQSASLRLPALQPGIVAPPPQVDDIRVSRGVGDTTVIAPPPQVSAATRVGPLDIGGGPVIAPAPKLPLDAQHTMPGRTGSSARETVLHPPPSLAQSAGANSSGRIVALGTNPVVSAPIVPPPGNRRGNFAAGPEGSANAAGTPGGGDATNTTAANPVPGVPAKDLPSGLFVGSPPTHVTPSAVAGSGNNGTPVAGADRGAALIPTATRPRTAIAESPLHEVSDAKTSALERTLFRDRKLYAMTVNLPNLNSAGGSWVIHFAELSKGVAPGALIGPVPLQAVDPGYPAQLMKENVEGTITLYAVIQRDGSVGDVRVMQGVDDRLDRYASLALSHWHFRPATKDGNAVPLEAIVLVPFHRSRHF